MASIQAPSAVTIQAITNSEPDILTNHYDDDNILSMTVSTYEEMNPRRRSTMEDCHVFHAPGTWRAPDPGLAYLGIYDGHGGREMVEYLETFLSFHVAEELRQEDHEANMATRLERAFLIADIHSTQCGVSTSGATVVTCLVKKISNTNKIVIHTANAGDARAVLGNQGAAMRLSHDHRVDDPNEVERINRAGGFLFKGRVLGVLAVTRSLGDHCMKEFVIAKPHYNETAIHCQNTAEQGQEEYPPVLILACDGLWDVMQDQEAVDLVLSFMGDRADSAQFLVEEAIRRGSTDNVSVVVAWL